MRVEVGIVLYDALNDEEVFAVSTMTVKVLVVALDVVNIDYPDNVNTQYQNSRTYRSYSQLGTSHFSGPCSPTILVS